jgi:hypothetical protein
MSGEDDEHPARRRAVATCQFDAATRVLLV